MRNVPFIRTPGGGVMISNTYYAGANSILKKKTVKTQSKGQIFKLRASFVFAVFQPFRTSFCPYHDILAFVNAHMFTCIYMCVSNQSEYIHLIKYLFVILGMF